MAKHPWIPIAPGYDVWPEKDGQYSVRGEQDMNPTLERNKELRRIEAEKATSADLGKHGIMHLIANMPNAVHQDMIDEVGHDTEGQKAWLRDHPQFLTCRARNADLPPKRIFCFPRKGR